MTAESTAMQSIPETDDLAHLRRAVHGLESLIRIPGTNITIGLDSIIGFLAPGIGDAVGGVASLGVLFTSLKRGVPKVILARMLLNIGIDVVGGLIPGIGDVFDVLWRANTKNLELLDRYESGGSSAAREHAQRVASTPHAGLAPAREQSTALERRETTAMDYVIVGGAVALVLISVAAPFVLIGWLLSAL